MDKSFTRVEQRESRALGKKLWKAWDGVTKRDCFNFMARLTRGCELRVWDLVRIAMG